MCEAYFIGGMVVGAFGSFFVWAWVYTAMTPPDIDDDFDDF